MFTNGDKFPAFNLLELLSRRNRFSHLSDIDQSLHQEIQRLTVLWISFERLIEGIYRLGHFQLRKFLQSLSSTCDFLVIHWGCQLDELSVTTCCLTPTLYWTLFEVNHRATLSLGAIYLLPQGDHYQLLNVQYYVSGKYYAAATLCEIWPMRVGEKSGALVWRGDFVSAPTLAFVRGTGRIVYGEILLQEIKKVVRCFQNDLKASAEPPLRLASTRVFANPGASLVVR